MRRQQDIVKLRQRGCKDCIVSLWFNRKYIDGGTVQVAALRAAHRASISTTVPREALMRVAAGFMAAGSRAPIKFAFAWFRARAG